MTVEVLHDAVSFSSSGSDSCDNRGDNILIGSFAVSHIVVGGSMLTVSGVVYFFNSADAAVGVSMVPDTDVDVPAHSNIQSGVFVPTEEDVEETAAVDVVASIGTGGGGRMTVVGDTLQESLDL